jgi:hypothetical protein
MLVEIDGKCCQQALYEYRDQLTRTWRAHKEIKAAEGAVNRLVRHKPLRRLVMDPANRERLERWRADKEQHSVVFKVDDPTSADREPGLRAFEDEIQR